MEPLNRLKLPEDIKVHLEPLIKPIPQNELPKYQRAVQAYFQLVKVAHARNGFVDLNSARELYQVSLFLLNLYPEFPPEEQMLAAAAVRYFLMSHGKEHDLTSVDGFEDDVETMNAVLDALGRSGQRIRSRV